ncbi:Uncharacterised protein [Bordetella pertussis]|nr:Uncharacterised protein [Bordetella pertussis]
MPATQGLTRVSMNSSQASAPPLRRCGLRGSGVPWTPVPGRAGV